jgi:two-component system sensor histidine kinase VanS
VSDTKSGRAPGLSVRWKLTLSYAAFLMVAGALLLAVVWVFLLRYVPANADGILRPSFPDRYDLIRAFAPPAAWALVFLLAFGLLGGWILAGLMLAPLARIANATRKATNG